jgi:hypothetical protein
MTRCGLLIFRKLLRKTDDQEFGLMGWMTQGWHTSKLRRWKSHEICWPKNCNWVMRKKWRAGCRRRRGDDRLIIQTGECWAVWCTTAHDEKKRSEDRPLGYAGGQMIGCCLVAAGQNRERSGCQLGLKPGVSEWGVWERWHGRLYQTYLGDRWLVRGWWHGWDGHKEAVELFNRVEFCVRWLKDVEERVAREMNLETFLDDAFR